ncbi:hypothetical protein FocTR4_00009676 [Fusarium oxysporum f. sp. cubense]|uniref:RING-type domain-containing protein n=1 Tax=Fusarium oxysporum f. sp. cubense TaxID=61366 RepID=A0A5C6T645_FUSOC|nr:hypothetical protein FocTR4_00009676 [Fusarium oxysporum f. sp. cubense]
MILTPNLIAREINGEHREPSVIFIILGIIAFGLVLLTPFILSKRGCHRPEPYQLDVPVPQRARNICLIPDTLDLIPITCYRETAAVEIDASKQVANCPGQASAPSCLICINEFKQGTQTRSLPCGHRFHPRCIDPWLLERSITCPVWYVLVIIHYLPARTYFCSRANATSELLPIARIPTIQSRGPGTAVPARPFQPQEPPLTVTLEGSCQIGSSSR